MKIIFSNTQTNLGSLRPLLQDIGAACLGALKINVDAYKGILTSRLLLVSVILGAYGLRIHRLGSQEVRGDEALAFLFSQHSFAEIIQSTLALKEPHPVASYFIESVWINLADHSEFALRYISLFFGVLAVALFYRLGKRLGLAQPTLLFGTALLAASPYVIWHSQDARMYGMYAMSLALTIALTWLAVEVLYRGGWNYWLAYTLVGWLALHTHYFAAFILLAANLFAISWFLFDRESRRRVIPWFAAQAALGLAYAPWLWQARSILNNYPGAADSPSLPEAARRALSVFAVGESVPVEQRGFFALLGEALLVLGIFWLVRGKSEQCWALVLLVLYLVIPLGLTWISSLNRPIFNERYLIAALPPFYLLVAIGIWETLAVMRWQAWSRRDKLVSIPLALLQSGLLVVLLIGMTLSLQRHYNDRYYGQTRGWRELAAELKRLTAGLPPNQTVVAENYPDPALWYYYTGPATRDVIPPLGRDAQSAVNLARSYAMAGVEWVILPLQKVDWWDNAGLAQIALAGEFTLIGEKKIETWPIKIYARVNPEALILASDSFLNALSFATAVRPSAGHGFAAPGTDVVVHLHWLGSPTLLAGSEKLFFHLLNTQGALVAQIDPFISRSDFEAPMLTYVIPLPDTLPPGNYRLIAGMYDPAQPGSPRIQTRSATDSIELATIEVNPF
ncbi:MAG: phospholipid carrier-dependent glycosyltransferase [Chloroflexi bacterium]|nr:phospholipid carrier-dependent glycosyltransferase [Chloroflexota bacterium]